MKLFTAPESRGGGPLSYICRLSGASHENWTFWLEVQLPFVSHFFNILGLISEIYNWVILTFTNNPFPCSAELSENLQASSSEEIRVEVAVLDQYMVDAAKKLKGLFPSWVDVTAYSSFLSSYVF